LKSEDFVLENLQGRELGVDENWCFYLKAILVFSSEYQKTGHLINNIFSKKSTLSKSPSSLRSIQNSSARPSAQTNFQILGI